MSFYNDGIRQDLATRRVLLVGQSGLNAAGNKFYHIHPWEEVEYANGIGGFEPRNAFQTNGHTNSLVADNSDRHPTSISFIGNDDFTINDEVALIGGNTDFPRR